MTRKCTGCRNGHELGFEIRTAFHPIVDLELNRVFAYEALVRGAAGETAFAVLSRVNSDNRYVFDQACRVNAIRDAVAAGILETDAKLSINFLPNAVYSPMACIQLTLATVRETGFPPDRLIFEFTETERIDVEHLKAIVAAYRSLGFETAIDDFGAGHSGLGLLANLQTDIVKLDMDLIRGIDTSLPRRHIVGGIAGLCGKMGIRLIAEGVETDAELQALRELGVRFVQGFIFCRPQIGGLFQLPSASARAVLAA